MRRAAGHRDRHSAQLLTSQLLTRAPGQLPLHPLLHISHHCRAGAFTVILPNPLLRLKPRGTNVGIPPGHGGHPAGTGSSPCHIVI